MENYSQVIVPRHVTAPAKINLALHVLKQEASGYHILQSLVVFLNKGDTLTVKNAAEDQLLITGRFAEKLAHCDDNLITKSLYFVKNFFDLKECLSLQINLQKELPVSAGVGGGSSDAAAMIVLLLKHWNLLPSQKDKKAKIIKNLIAKSSVLGADVPMCLYGLLYKKPLLVTNFGDKIQPLHYFPKIYILLINLNDPIATHNVFKALIEKNNAPFQWTDSPLTYSQIIKKLKTLRNDLYPVVLKQLPYLDKIILKLYTIGADFAGMSGSGATCFGVFPSEQKLKEAQFYLQTCYRAATIIEGQTFGCNLSS